MEKKDAQLLSEILDEILQQNNLDIGLNASRAKEAWREVMGDSVTQYTVSLHFNNGTLYVQLSSPILRNELFMNRRQLIARLNAHIGRDVVSKIHFK
ncbi:MAG: DUF721 domain-containing protein [Bacteroidaceae bacterium]|nr:DUF721 domain-containing protein [Bacteroidaceae bacterium]